MDMYKLKWTRLQNEIFRFLCIKTGMAVNQRGIAKALRVSPTAVANSLKNLEKDGLIKVERNSTMNLTTIRLNRDNRKTMGLKRVANLGLVYESGLIEFLEERFPGSVIILFGSYSRGEDIVESDIDIAIIGVKEKEVNSIDFEKKFERKIYLHFYPSFIEINKNLKENILNGIVLIGGVEL